MVMPESERIRLEGKSEVDEKAITMMVETAKENEEVRAKITEMFLEGIDKKEFKKILIDKALGDPELRKKIMLEIIKKL